jgi:hypothetical protein
MSEPLPGYFLNLEDFNELEAIVARLAAFATIVYEQQVDHNACHDMPTVTRIDGVAP